MFVGSCEDARYLMLHGSLEVARGSSKVACGDYEDVIKCACDLQADALRCWSSGVTENEDGADGV